MIVERYALYKDSGIEWIGDYPSSWRLVNLSSLVDQRKNKNSDLSEDNVLSLSYGQIKKRARDNSGLLPESFDTYNIIEDGDIVLRLTDLQNDKISLRVGRSSERGIITSAYTTLAPRVVSKYLFYMLATFDYWKGFYGLAGGVRQSLNYDGIKNLRFLLPSQSEQMAIADYLDQKTVEIDLLIEQTERSIELLEEYRRSVISEAVTKGLNPDASMKNSGIEWVGKIPESWTTPKLKYISRIESGATPDRENYSYWDGTIPWIKTGELQNGRTTEALEFITERALNETSVKLFPQGTVLVAMYGQGKTRGMTSLLEIEACTNQACAGIQPDPKVIVPEFLQLFMIASYDAIRLTALGSGQPNLSLDLIGNWAVCIPPLYEQAAIVCKIQQAMSHFDKLLDYKRELLTALQDYRKSLISEATTGKFKVPGVE